MLKDFAWNTFIKTGAVNSYIFLREIEERNKASEQNEAAEAKSPVNARHV